MIRHLLLLSFLILSLLATFSTCNLCRDDLLNDWRDVYNTSLSPLLETDPRPWPTSGPGSICPEITGVTSDETCCTDALFELAKTSLEHEIELWRSNVDEIEDGIVTMASTVRDHLEESYQILKETAADAGVDLSNFGDLEGLFDGMADAIEGLAADGGKAFSSRLSRCGRTLLVYRIGMGCLACDANIGDFVSNTGAGEIYDLAVSTCTFISDGCVPLFSFFLRFYNRVFEVILEWIDTLPDEIKDVMDADGLADTLGGARDAMPCDPDVQDDCRDYLCKEIIVGVIADWASVQQMANGLQEVGELDPNNMPITKREEKLRLAKAIHSYVASAISTLQNRGPIRKRSTESLEYSSNGYAAEQVGDQSPLAPPDVAVVGDYSASSIVVPSFFLLFALIAFILM